MQKLTDYLYEVEDKLRSQVILIDYDKITLDKFKKTFIENYVNSTNDIIISMEKTVKQLQTNIIDNDSDGLTKTSSTMKSAITDLQSQISSLVSSLTIDIKSVVGFDIDKVKKTTK